LSKDIPLKEYLTDPLWKSNQILIAILGICSALGITTKISIAVTMALSVTFVTACSSFCVSLVRKQTPDSVRMIAQLAIISMFVIVVNEFLKAYLFELSKVLSVFVGLIITNCIVMGRTESMAKNVPPIPAFLDGLGAGAGYGVVIILLAVIREFFGFGTLMGFPVVPQWIYASAEHPDAYQNFGLMLSPPAAFFILGLLIWSINSVQGRKTA
jgi:Na+-transporting NADH:ubiquinone oxidoreductase subunit D